MEFTPRRLRLLLLLIYQVKQQSGPTERARRELRWKILILNIFPRCNCSNCKSTFLGEITLDSSENFQNYHIISRIYVLCFENIVLDGSENFKVTAFQPENYQIISNSYIWFSVLKAYRILVVVK